MEQILRAVAAGDGFMVDVLLAVLEVVADEALLQRLAEAMGRIGRPPHLARSRATCAGRPVFTGTRPRPGGPGTRPASDRRP
ncbi:hypothetical protein [Kitasatospora sp. NPDC051914]|uniref:hypothetical protein n=1 Tax=Kitasatospora sp. NPDC051914 TaxID=3154945 RepID=UPI0034291762